MNVELTEEQADQLAYIIEGHVEWLETEGYKLSDREMRVTKELEKIFMQFKKP